MTAGLGQTTAPTLAFSGPIYYAYEDTGAASISVTRSGNTNSAVAVSYAMSTRLATPGVDFTPQSGTLSFASGETSKSFSIPLMDDALAEGSEPVDLTLSNPTGGAVLGAQATARLYIQDNENRGTLLDSAFLENAVDKDDGVNGISLQPDGKILAVGVFAAADPGNPDRVIRLQPDGTRDPSFVTTNSTPSNSVYAAALQPDGKVLIGGAFTQVGSVTRNRIARLNADGSLDSSFDPGAGPAGANSPAVFCITLQKDGKVLIGGNFDTVGGAARIDVARLNANGSLDATFQPGAGLSTTNRNYRVPWVSAISILPNNKILIGGQFTAVDGLSLRNIARLNADGTVDSTFDPGLGAVGDYASVEAIALQADGKIIIGGGFDKVNDLDRSALARLNPDGSADASFDTGLGVKDTDANGNEISGLVTAVTVQPDGRILFGGSYWTVDGINRHGLARVNADGSLDAAFGPYYGTTFRNDLGWEEMVAISAFALQRDGKVVIGGTFAWADGTELTRLTRLLSTNVRTSSFEFSTPTSTVSERSGPVSIAVMRRGDSVGAFTLEYATMAGSALPSLDFTARSGTLRFAALEVEKTISVPILEDGSVEDDKTFNVVLSNPSAGSTLGAPTNFVVRIIDSKKLGNLDASFAAVDIPFPSDPTSNLPVTAILLQGDMKAVVAGNFTTVNGTNRAGLVRLNVDGTVDASFVPQPAPGSQVLNVLQMGLQPDGRIIGGYDGVFRLNPNGSRDAGFDPGLGEITALTAMKDGRFLTADEYYDRSTDAYLDEVLRFQADGTIDPNFTSVVLNDWVTAMAVQPDNKVIIGGYFTQADGSPQNRIARLTSTGSLDASFDVGTGLEGTNSAVYGLTLQPDGKVIITGSFLRFNGLSRRYLVRLNANGSVDAGFNPGSGPNNFVETAALQPDGKVLIAGAFSSCNGVLRFGLARLNNDGSVDLRFEPKLRFPGPVYVNAVAVQPDGQILIAGLFTAVNGISRLGLARLNGDGNQIQLTPTPRAPGGPFQLTVTTWPGKQYRLDASPDLVNWLPIQTNTAAGFTLNLDDPSAPALGTRFYRAVVLGP